ncbi:MAG: hypothetical protein IJ435_06365 [Clostridia bacterium]|nr:hypothetical protein [Clostridia bacterium]
MQTLFFIPILWTIARADSYYDSKQKINRYIYIQNEFLSKLFITKRIAHYHNRKVKKEHYNKLSYLGVWGYVLTLTYTVLNIFALCFFSDGAIIYATKQMLMYFALGIGTAILCPYFLNDGEMWEKGVAAKIIAVMCALLLLVSTVYMWHMALAYFKMLYMICLMN